MNLPLPADMERLIEDEVRSGRSASAGEFLDKAVYHYLLARDLGESYTREEIEAKIARGLAQAERGESLDGPAAFSHLRQRYHNSGPHS